MPRETLETETRDGVLTVTLDRPERLNAFNLPMLHELLEVLDEADADDAVRAIIVTGAGRAFCAGADLGRAAAPSTTAGRSPTRSTATGAGCSPCASSSAASP